MITQKEMSDSIVGWLATWKTKSDKSNPVVKWIIIVVLAIAAFFIAAYLSWRAWSQWRELADLRHKRDLLEQEKIHAKVDEAIADMEAAVAELNKRIADLDREISSLDEQITTVDNNMKVERAKIDAINNWEDIDLYVRTTGLDK